MLQAMHGAFDEAERDGAVVLLDADARGYLSAGFDLKVFAGGDVDQVIEMLTLGATLAERILPFATPVITACSGTRSPPDRSSAGGRLRIGVDGPSRIGLNEVKIGLTVPWFEIELARQRLAPAHFNRAVVSATMTTPPRR